MADRPERPSTATDAETAQVPPGDPRANASAALDHLQGAALELIAAARSVLDAAEEVVQDPDALRHATGALTSIVDAAAKIGRSAAGAATGHGGAARASSDDNPIERIRVD